jgi:endonuclease YncB( thermonuclease family)
MLTPMILGQVTQQQAILAQVVSVSDGDTLTIQNASGQNIVIKLGCIDAPEKNQPGGKESAQRLSTLLPKGVTVLFKPFGDKDQYGRTLGVVGRGVQFINLELLQEGQAWIYEKENSRCQGFTPVFREAQATAQQQRLGLWSQANPCPPWDYRSNKCGAIRTPPPKKRTSPDVLRMPVR